MKRTVIIAVILGLLGALLLSGTALAFDPQPEPPGIAALGDNNPGVTGAEALSFSNLFPIHPQTGGSESILLPFGRSLIKGFDPQPEPPGLVGIGN